MRKRKQIDPGDTLGLHLSRIGEIGGRSRSPEKLAALRKNLIAAYRKRWPGRPIPDSLKF